MTERDIQRELGRLEATVEHLDVRAEKIEEKIDTLIEFMASAKGGWRVLLGIAGVAGAAGAALTHFFTELFGK